MTARDGGVPWTPAVPKRTRRTRPAGKTGDPTVDRPAQQARLDRAHAEALAEYAAAPDRTA